MAETPGPTKITGVKQIAYCTCLQSGHWPDCDATHHSVGGEGPEIIELDENKTCFEKIRPLFEI